MQLLALNLAGFMRVTGDLLVGLGDSALLFLIDMVSFVIGVPSSRDLLLPVS